VGEDTREIAQAIRAERHDLGRNLDELQEHAKALTDWRTHYRRHAGTSLAVAFGGGVMLGLLASGGSSRNGAAGRRWKKSNLAADLGESGTRPPSVSRSSKLGLGKLTALKHLADNPRARRQMGDAWEHMLEALIGVASAKAIDFIGNVVPGFREEYHSRTDGDARGHGDAPRRAGMAPMP